jgi:phage gp45-like
MKTAETTTPTETSSEVNVPSAQNGDGPTALVLASGRRIQVDPLNSDQINISSPDGTFELSVKFTSEGAVFNLSAAQLNLRSSGAINMECQDLAIRAERSIALDTGSMVQTVTEDHRTLVGGQSQLEAHAVSVRSRLGDVAIDANDYVKVTGEKILLNR